MIRTVLQERWRESPSINFRAAEDGRYVNEDYIGHLSTFGSSGPDFEALEAHYNIVLSEGRLPWREIILSLQGIQYDSETNILSAETRKLDSATLMATRRGVVSPTQGVESVINGLLRSKDGSKLLLGVRGGNVMSGTRNIVPAGAVTYNETKNPLLSAFYSEAYQELGLEKDSLSCPKLIGYHSQTSESGAPNNLFLYVADLKTDIEEVINNHARGFKLYQDEIKLGRDEETARKLLMNSPHPCDSWEHSLLEVIDNDPEKILSFALENSRKDSLTQGMYGSLPIYVLHEFGKRAFSLLMGIKEFAERTDMNDFKLHL